MSGLEVAGLAVGVVPIVVTAARAYKTLNEHLHTLRQRHLIASCLWLKFRMIQARIRDTFKHFLAPVLQENDPWQLMQDDVLTAEQKSDIVEHIQRSLGKDSAAIFTEVFKEIAKILEEVRESLANVEKLALADPRTSRPKSKSTKEAVDIMLHLPRYEKYVDELRAWIGELSHLLTANGYPSKLENRPEHKHTLPLPSSVIAINKASKELGTGLEKAWSCLNTKHGGHSAVLWFDAQLDMNDAVHTNIAISCRKTPVSKPSVAHVPENNIEKSIWLHVKSEPPKCPTGVSYQNKRPKTSMSTPLFHTHGENPRSNSSLMNTGASSTITIKPTPQILSLDSKSNLESLPSVCCHLYAASFLRSNDGCKCQGGHTGTARGYLGTMTGYEHAIFDRIEPGKASSLVSNSHSVTEYLGKMTTIQQLKTAREITLGLLKYSHTPWLREDWSLNDVSYLDQSSFDHTTFHLSKKLPKKKFPDALTTEATTPAVQELRGLLGIRSMPLANLGHALLELAHRKPLKELRQAGDPHNAVAARRLVNGVDTIFGSRYRRIVRKCLEADFVVDCTDISDGRLQTAIYNDVVLELESLAQDFERILKLV